MFKMLPVRMQPPKHACVETIANKTKQMNVAR